MESFILSREVLPEQILSFIHAEKILVSVENETVTLAPIREEKQKKRDYKQLKGILSGTGISYSSFIEERQKERDAEYERETHPRR